MKRSVDCRLANADCRVAGVEDRVPTSTRPTRKRLMHFTKLVWLAPFYFCFFMFLGQAADQKPLVQAVDTIGMTVSDVDRSVEFFSKVLSFEKVSDVEVTGRDSEQLQGVFGLRMRLVRLKLGDEHIELTEFLAPRGRPFPVDTRSNDHWFQHIAIIVSDMDNRSF